MLTRFAVQASGQVANFFSTADAERAYHPPVKNARDVATVTDNVAWKEKGAGAHIRKVDPVISCASSRWEKSYLHRLLRPSISLTHTVGLRVLPSSAVRWGLLLFLHVIFDVSVVFPECFTSTASPSSASHVPRCSSQLLFCFSDSLSPPMFPPAPHPPSLSSVCI